MSRDPTTFFHTTERLDAERIIREGFEACYASLGEAVYFYGSLASAETFARQRSYRTFKDPVILAVQDSRPRKVDKADLDGLQDFRVYADVWIVGLDEGESRFMPERVWVEAEHPRQKRVLPARPAPLP